MLPGPVHAIALTTLISTFPDLESFRTSPETNLPQRSNLALPTGLELLSCSVCEEGSGLGAGEEDGVTRGRGSSAPCICP